MDLTQLLNQPEVRKEVPWGVEVRVVSQVGDVFVFCLTARSSGKVRRVNCQVTGLETNAALGRGSPFGPDQRYLVQLLAQRVREGARELLTPEDPDEEAKRELKLKLKDLEAAAQAMNAGLVSPKVFIDEYNRALRLMVIGFDAALPTRQTQATSIVLGSFQVQGGVNGQFGDEWKSYKRFESLQDADQARRAKERCQDLSAQLERPVRMRTDDGRIIAQAEWRKVTRFEALDLEEATEPELSAVFPSRFRAIEDD